MKMRKIIAGVCALSMFGTVSAVGASAEVITDNAETTEIVEVTEVTSEEVSDNETEKPELPEDEKPELPEDEMPELPEDKYDFEDDFADIIENDEDFKNFIMKDKVWKKFNKRHGIVTINEAGCDKNGNKIFSHNSDVVINGYDENNEPVFETEECTEEHKFLGFDDNGEKLFSNNKHDKFIWIDENGNPVDATADCVDEEKDLYKTIDVNKGYDILVKHDADNDDYYALNNGDANADSFVDIRDIALLKRTIVKLAELPDYMVTADIDHDTSIDIEDLGMLIKFIIGICDINA